MAAAAATVCGAIETRSRAATTIVSAAAQHETSVGCGISATSTSVSRPRVSSADGAEPLDTTGRALAARSRSASGSDNARHRVAPDERYPAVLDEQVDGVLGLLDRQFRGVHELTTHHTDRAWPGPPSLRAAPGS
jgi:hypothetical protein